MTADRPAPRRAHAEAIDSLLDYVQAVAAVRAIVEDAESRGQTRSSNVLLRAALSHVDKHRKAPR